MKSLVLAMGVLFATAALSLPSQQTDITYFESSELENPIGFEMVMSCFGKPNPPSVSGGKTSFYVKQITPCENTPKPKKFVCYFHHRVTTCPVGICESGLFDCED